VRVNGGIQQVAPRFRSPGHPKDRGNGEASDLKLRSRMTLVSEGGVCSREGKEGTIKNAAAFGGEGSNRIGLGTQSG